MTIQALAWAIDQPVPGKAKLVLIALANRTDHINGRCELDVEAVSREATLTMRGIWPYLGALVRNGYVKREGENILWIIFDRALYPAWEWHQSADIDAEVEGESLEPAPSITASAPIGFNAKRQTQQISQNIKDHNKSNEPVFVIEDTRAWQAWVEHRRSHGQVAMATCNGHGENAGRRGWYMPTLFPPQQPTSQTIDQDLKEFIDSG